ncbi:nucleotidyltransferase domain-containing protein [Pistricoccus aurantiacus]|uniref:Nucleotidyltransferase domain-containing protein n=2 Tax=Pistricoccus aurantiacus TaxID=1883414 RepID=A0A5B8SUV0_9GAMM|nr:nucleotidyltransferase domain-containing protein [Pistricoccus aurantiacus]
MMEDSNDVASVIASIENALSDFPELKQIVLFGSLARQQAGFDSDVDVGVEAARSLSVEQRMAMIEALALALGRPVDLVDLREAGQPILDQIVTTGVRIKGTDTDWGRLIYRNIMDNEDFVPLQKRILKARRDAWINR